MKFPVQFALPTILTYEEREYIIAKAYEDFKRKGSSLGRSELADWIDSLQEVTQGFFDYNVDFVACLDYKDGEEFRYVIIRKQI